DGGIEGTPDVVRGMSETMREELNTWGQAINLGLVEISEGSIKAGGIEKLDNAAYQRRLMEILGFVQHSITGPPLEVEIVIMPLLEEMPLMWYESSGKITRVYIQILALSSYVPLSYALYAGHHEFVVHVYRGIKDEKEAGYKSALLLSNFPIFLQEINEYLKKNNMIKVNTNNMLLESMLEGMIQEGWELEVIKQLLEMKQEHLFENWEKSGVNDGLKIDFLKQIKSINGTYPGKVTRYMENARREIASAVRGDNPFEGLSPRVPEGAELTGIDDNYHMLEEIGIERANRIAVVMVAGGLGERLGYSGIKVSIPLSLVTMDTYLDWYLKNTLALQEKSNRINVTNYHIPFVIMTSPDTDARTKELLESRGFRVVEENDEGQYSRYEGSDLDVEIIRQGAVPAVKDVEGNFTLEQPEAEQDQATGKNKAGNYLLKTKPHGHGDVHMLLEHYGLVDKWIRDGRTHTVFIQDTNGQVFNAIPAGIGVSVELGLDFNFLTVPREAGAKVGAIVDLVRRDGSVMTANVEYNQLEPVLMASGHVEGDAADKQTGKSPYPGNLNIFIVKNTSYGRVLNATGGVIGEFVNPKFADSTRKAFKTATRLETMMQDLAKVMGERSKVGFTNFNERDVFSPVKNSLAGGAENVEKKGIYPDTMATGEADLYKYYRKLLKMAGVDIDVEGQKKVTQGIPYSEGAKVVLSPAFGRTVKEVLGKVKGGRISGRSTLYLEGEGIEIEDLDLDGTLIVKVGKGVNVSIKGLKVKNAGWKLEEMSVAQMKDEETPAYLKIRGYELKKEDAGVVIDIQEPGRYKVLPDLRRIRYADGGKFDSEHRNYEVNLSAIPVHIKLTVTKERQGGYEWDEDYKREDTVGGIFSEEQIAVIRDIISAHQSIPVTIEMEADSTDSWYGGYDRFSINIYIVFVFGQKIIVHSSEDKTCLIRTIEDIDFKKLKLSRDLWLD
ncbi:MAG: UTP--glucose-1-phosphate uridylyltransferase, partial [Dehalococcoidia bacterium]